MTEERIRRDDPDYAQEFRYEGGAGPCGLRALWVDAHGGCWLESEDGQRVVIPPAIRRLVAGRVREATYR